MIDGKILWKKRFGQYVKEVRRYLRYMLNDHLLFVLIFAVGAGAFYYNQWLETLTPEFPSAFIMSLVFALVLTHSPVQTLLKEADLVFLLPIEKKLSSYFQRAFIFSFLFQSYSLIIVIALIAPLYFATTGNEAVTLMILFIILLFVKVWNMSLNWSVQFYIEPIVHYTDVMIRLLLNGVFTYFLLIEAGYVFSLAIGIIMLLLYLYFQKATANKSLKWEHLIDLQSKRMMTFYRIANLFTDVPKLKERVKRRKWLDWTTKFLRYSQASTYSHLYMRTFLRTSDYFGIYTRLLVIGGIILYAAPLQYGKLLVLMLFLYLTGFQLLTLWRHHNLKIWVDLYPIPNSLRKKAFLQILSTLLVIQSFLFSMFVIASSGAYQGLLALFVGIVFSFLFVYVYVQEKLKKFS